MNFHHQKILVIGLGKSGMSMLRFLHEAGAQVAGYDRELSDERRSELAQAYPQASFYAGSLQEALRHDDFTAAALSPGVSAFLPELDALRARGGKVLGDVEILCSLIHGRRDKIIAITGSNGKSTVTELVGFLCRECGLDTVVAGNIGLPVLDAYRERGGESADVWVLELSSFQLETVNHLAADAAACLNVSEDHLDRYDDLLDYAHAKDRVFRGARVQVLNADDVLCRAMKRPDAQTRWFSLQQPADFWVDAEHVIAGEEKLAALADLPLHGLHNAANIAAALALCEGVGLARADLLAALPSFQGLPHRVQKIGALNGVSFIDDSKGTNVGATAAALLGATAPVVLIAGGLGKGQDFAPLAAAAQGKVKATFLIGRDAPAIAQAFQAASLGVTHCDTLPEAVEKAFQAASAGDWVLLSPACASMDMFRDYAHRAEVFIESFKALS
ncbi:MAG: UDP-N-acetylmuramoyl-L-alanine--D-glutamate ligase [Neisseria sp.]|nr:UDP-N-acetylmuramoyl-L-alanine--D-glutamate ligase [Neisseria sp.]